MEQIGAARIAGFDGPYRIRQRDSHWNEHDAACYSADFVHRTAVVHQCTCWRLANFFNIYTTPPYNTLICDECRNTSYHRDTVPKTVRVYFDMSLRPIHQVSIGRSGNDDDFTAFQPSSNNSSC